MVYGTIAILEPEKQIYPKYSWGEMYETLKTMKENGDDSEDPVFTRFFEAVKELDDAKTLTEVKTILTKYNFSENEIERINSPCYDGLTFVLKIPEGELISKLVDKQIYIETCKYLLLKDMTTRTLARACKYNNLEMVKLMIINASSNEKNRALKASCGYGHITTVKFLLENGADNHFENDASICVASQSGQLEIVKLLIEYGSNIHTRDECSLINAVKNSQLQVVQFLLQQGADVNAQETICMSLAIMNERLDFVELLYDFGANITEKMIQKACDTKNANIIKYIIPRIHFSFTNLKIPPSISTVFFNTIVQSNDIYSSVFSSLLTLGYGQELLSEAIKTVDISIVKFLLQKGVKVPKNLSSRNPEIEQLLNPKNLSSQNNSHKRCTIM